MTESKNPGGGSALQRWSQRKLEAAREKEKGAVAPAPANAAAPAPTAPASAVRTEEEAAPGHVLPPVEGLTIESDFSAFLEPSVDAALKRQALKQLFRDPHFNVMDGLDVYVGDYSQPDPISPDIVRQMVQGRYIFDPPPTRINAQGFCEDVPADEIAALKGDPQPPALDVPPEPGSDAAAAPSLPPAENAATSAAPARQPNGETPPIGTPDAADPEAR